MIDFEGLLQGEDSKRFSAKQAIYHEGDEVSRIYQVRSGLIKLLTYLPNGRARIVRIHTEGHWIGLEGLINKPHEHTAVAIDDVELSYIAISKLEELEKDQPEKYCELLKQVYDHLEQADRWIADFSTGGIKSRVARLLDYLSELKFGESDKVELLTVHEMADMLGVTQESVSRVLAEFKRSDILNKISIDSEDTYGIDSDKLQEEADQ